MNKTDQRLLLKALKNAMPQYDYTFDTTTMRNDISKEFVMISFDKSEFVPFFDPDDYKHLSFEETALVLKNKLKSFSISEPKVFEELLSREQILKNVKMQLVNTRKNKDYLNDFPHLKVNCELSALFYLPMYFNDPNPAIIKNDLLEEFSIDLDTLKECAIKNMSKDITLSYLPVIEDGKPKTTPLLDDISSTKTLFEELKNKKLTQPVILSNRSKTFGAASILCEDFFHEIKQDIIIFPASVHQVLLLPFSKDFSDLKELQNVLETTNRLDLPKDEFLSNCIYLYQPLSKNLSIVCDSFGLVPLCEEANLTLPKSVSRMR